MIDETAASLVREIQPRVAIPMHYGNPQVRFFEFDPVEKFLKLFESVVTLPDSTYQVRRRDLPEDLTIFVPALPERKE